MFRPERLHVAAGEAEEPHPPKVTDAPEKAVGRAMERLPDAPSADEILAAAFASAP